MLLKAISVSLFPRTWLYYAKCLNYFRGASIECRDKDKDTPLLMAASKNHLDTIRSLLRHGADIGAKDSNDETPIYRAASEGCIEALEVRWHVFVQTYCSCILGVTVFIHYKQFSHVQYTQTNFSRNCNFTIRNNNRSLPNKMQFSDLVHLEDSLLWSVKLQIVLLYFWFFEPYEIGFIEEPSNSSSVMSNILKRSAQGYRLMNSTVYNTTFPQVSTARQREF